MAAGDFLEIYGDSQQTAQWDCVMTCFFMDTARNIIEYVEVINNCLAEGGLWVNLGELMRLANVFGLLTAAQSVHRTSLIPLRRYAK